MESRKRLDVQQKERMFRALALLEPKNFTQPPVATVVTLRMSDKANSNLELPGHQSFGNQNSMQRMQFRFL